MLYFHNMRLNSAALDSKVIKVTNHTGLWNTKLTWYSPTAGFASTVWTTALKFMVLGISNFAWLSKYLQPRQNFLNHLVKNVASNIEQVLAATPHKAPTIQPPAFHHENYSSQTNQTCRTLLEKQGWAHKWCTPMDPHIWQSKSRMTSSNIHTAAMWGYGM